MLVPPAWGKGEGRQNGPNFQLPKPLHPSPYFFFLAPAHCTILYNVVVFFFLFFFQSHPLHPTLGIPLTSLAFLTSYTILTHFLPCSHLLDTPLHISANSIASDRCFCAGAVVLCFQHDIIVESDKGVIISFYTHYVGRGQICTSCILFKLPEDNLLVTFIP